MASDTQAGTRALVELLSRFELRGRKRHEFEVWSAAVELWGSGLADRAELARGLQREITGLRRFRPPGEADVVAVPESVEALRGYLHGFLCAEGSFRLGRSRTTLTVHLRQDDRPLLQMFEARAAGRAPRMDDLLAAFGTAREYHLASRW